MEINILVTVTDASAIELNISYDGVSATLKDIKNHNNSKDSHNGHFTDPNLHFNEERLTRLRAGTNYELDCEKVGGVFQLTGLPEDIADERVIVIFEAPEIYRAGEHLDGGRGELHCQDRQRQATQIQQLYQGRGADSGSRPCRKDPALQRPGLRRRGNSGQRNGARRLPMSTGSTPKAA